MGRLNKKFGSAGGGGKGEGSSLDIAPLTILDSGAYNLGSGRWLALAVVLQCKLVAAHSPR